MDLFEIPNKILVSEMECLTRVLPAHSLGNPEQKSLLETVVVFCSLS